MGWSLYFVADKALKSRTVKLLSVSHADAMLIMQRLYNLAPERITILCHIPLVE